MALTDTVPTETSNLLQFANIASSNIQEAFGKQSKQRKVNVRKFIQKRVKRLNDNKGKTSPKLSISTKSKLALPNTTPDRRREMLAQMGSQSLPEFPSQPPCVPQTIGLPTSSHPTTQLHYSYSVPSMYAPPMDPELDSLLTELGLKTKSVPTSRHTSVSPPPTLESQVYLAEHPFSPYSDCSDELFEDSAYSSPVGYNCTTTGMVAPINPVVTTAPYSWTPANSPPTSSVPCPVDLPYNCADWMEPTSLPVSSSCGWVSSCATSSTMSTIANQVPPMTPTVSQLLDQYNY